MRLLRLPAVLIVTGALAAGCGGSAGGAGSQLNLVAYSTPREAYGELTSLFRETPVGKDVSITQSYGSSGEQARAVVAGLEADVVALSLAPDMDQLVRAGLVDSTWTEQPHDGMISHSLVVFVVREGNPKGIEDWDDLLRPDVDVVTPNPFTSGGARWNVMAAYGAWRKAGKTDEQAQANLLQLFENVVVQDTSARASLNTFNSGKGDVLLAYENEAVFARTQGLDLPFVIPKATILIENPIAVIKSSPDKAAANAFLRFLRTPAAQQVFAENGYRPVVSSVLEKNRKEFPARPGEFTVDQLGLGGWVKVQNRFFDPKSGIMARIQRQVGGSTG